MNTQAAGRKPQAFTLVELLVVVTIIVVLLALLSPAMDKAIYSAELTVCATRHRALAAGVTQYVMQNRQHYPYRFLTDTSVAGTAEAVTGNRNGWPCWVGIASEPLNDDRPMYRPYFSLNKTLNCPLIPALDFETTGVWCPYNLWFGFGYHNTTGTQRSRGLYKIGDRMEWDDNSITPMRKVSSSLLSGTRYITTDNGPFVSGSHNDNGEGYYLAMNTQLVRWDSDVTRRSIRGPVDLNFAFADLSVLRYNQVEWDDNERMVHVPGYSDSNGWPNNHEIIPRQ